MNHDGANHRGVANHRPLRLLSGNAAALHQLVVLAPVLFKPRVGFIIDDLKVNAGLDLQAQLLDAHFNHARAAHQNRFGQSQRHQLWVACSTRVSSPSASTTRFGSLRA